MGVGSPDLGGAVHGPDTPDDDGGAGEGGTVGEGDGVDALFEFEGDGGVEAEGFVEEGECAGDIEGLEGSGGYFLVSGEGGSVFFEELCYDGRVTHEGVEGPGQGLGCCVSAGGEEV